MGRSQVVRQRILIPPFPGSSPGAPAKNFHYFMTLGIDRFLILKLVRGPPARRRGACALWRVHASVCVWRSRSYALLECAESARPWPSDDFIDCYNNERPHQALNMQCPAERYVPSTRAYQGLPDFDYPFHDKSITVTTCGRICFNRQKINLSVVFAGQSVGIKQVSDETWLISFMDDLGYFDQETCRLEPIENPFGPPRSAQVQLLSAEFVFGNITILNVFPQLILNVRSRRVRQPVRVAFCVLRIGCVPLCAWRILRMPAELLCAESARPCPSVSSASSSSVMPPCRQASSVNVEGSPILSRMVCTIFCIPLNENGLVMPARTSSAPHGEAVAQGRSRARAMWAGTALRCVA